MKFYIVDVFAEAKYQGNQLAVLIPDRDLSTEEMQQIAREINFSETTFIVSGKENDGGYQVRIFTPDVEIPFAGHPTLGTAFVIYELLEKRQESTIYLNLGVGQIPVDVKDGYFIMKQNQPEFDMIINDTNLVSQTLKIDADNIRTDYPIQVVSTGLPCVVVPLTSVDAVSKCAIDHQLFEDFFKKYVKTNLLVFAPDGERSLRVRVFMDDTGFLEDPATGSANGNLAGYVLKHDFFGSRNIEYTVSQGSEIGRPSKIQVTASEINNDFNIRVGGKVYLVSEGNWM